jgi:hypothetical protein
MSEFQRWQIENPDGISHFLLGKVRDRKDIGFCQDQRYSRYLITNTTWFRAVQYPLRATVHVEFFETADIQRLAIGGLLLGNV